MGQQTHGTLTVYEGGTRIDLFCPYTATRKQIGGGPRSSVKTFSRASRLRLIKLLASLRQESILNSKMITLTYHEQFNDIKRDLKHFKQFLHRNQDDCSAIWRLEFQERGAPHYHLLFFGRYIAHHEIASHWNDIADPGNKAHLKAGVEIRSCNSVNRIGPYLCKYLGKTCAEQKVDNAGGMGSRYGRHWGVFNRKRLPVGQSKRIPIAWEKAASLIEWELSKHTPFTTAKSHHTIFTRTPGESRDYINEVLNNELWNSRTSD